MTCINYKVRLWTLEAESNGLGSTYGIAWGSSGLITVVAENSALLQYSCAADKDLFVRRMRLSVSYFFK